MHIVPESGVSSDCFSLLFVSPLLRRNGGLLETSASGKRSNGTVESVAVAIINLGSEKDTVVSRDMRNMSYHDFQVENSV
jgi:hypothetical protein